MLGGVVLVVVCCAAVEGLGTAVVVLIVGAGFDACAAVEDFCETIKVVVGITIMGGLVGDGFGVGGSATDAIIIVVMSADDALAGAVNQLGEFVAGVILIPGADAVGEVGFLQAATGVKQEVDLLAVAGFRGRGNGGETSGGVVEKIAAVAVGVATGIAVGDGGELAAGAAGVF